MTPLPRLRSLLKALLTRARVESSMDEELRFHVESRADDLARSGVPRAEAERRARVEFGAVEAYKERCRKALGLRLLDELRQDARYALRGLRRNPGFAAVALVTLGLGIGANTAMFTIVESVLLRPLPYREPDRLVMVYSVGSFGPFRWTDGPLADPDILLLRDLPAFSESASFNTAEVSLTGAGDPMRVSRSEVTASLLPLLGASPALGRGFVEPDEGKAVVILSNALWRSRHAADPGVIGRWATIDGVPHTIIGVMPAGFNFPLKAQLWTPLRLRPGYRDNAWNRAIARLSADTTEAQALSVVEIMLRNAGGDRAARKQGPTARIVRLQEAMVGDARRLVLIALGVVGFVLLIACTNIANLVMARAASRGQEMAIRASLGAGRRRLLRQMLTESIVLAALGGGLGLALASTGVPFLRAWVPPASRSAVESGWSMLPRLEELRLDAVVVGFTCLVSLAGGLIFGLAPALAASCREAPRPDQARGGGAPTRGERRTRGALVVAEVALVLVLLAGAGLLLKSFWRLQRVDPGFRRDRLLTLQVTLAEHVYQTVEQKREIYARLLEGLSGLPGVADVSAVNLLPFGSLLWRGDFVVEGRGHRPVELVVGKPAVSERYFQAMGIPLRRGRSFQEGDREGAPPVAIVSESVAGHCWPGEDPIGRRIMMDDPKENRWLNVVGVVGDVRQDSLAADPLPMIYVPFRQEWRGFFLGSMSYVMRTELEAGALAGALRRHVHALDPELPVEGIQALDRLLSASVAEPRYRAGVVLGFALLALALALVGIYGVIAYEVTRRTAEIGIRRALGASNRAILWLVLGRTLALVSIGLTLGLLGAGATTRVLESFLFAVKPLDVETFVLVPVCLAGAAVLASLAPARRAAHVDPATALRYE